MDKIAIKLTIRNEHDYLDEWFQYHISIGFINYIVYDDVSTDKTNSILNFYKSLVNIDTYIIDSSKCQHFKDPIKFDDYDYILNIDIDEFLYISHNLRSKYNNLENYLADKKSNNYSVIEIPSFDCEDKTNFNADSVDIFLKRLNYKSNMRIKFSEKLFCNFYNKFGFLIVRNLFEKRQIDKIVNQAKDIYKIQMKKLNIITSCDIDNNTFEEKIKILFENNFNTFLNCGKQCQHIIDLWKLSLDDKILNIIKMLGIQCPIISTRPVLFSNSKHISKSDINHTVPPHQDWASMQGSVNSIVCWVPLIDINQDLGSVALIPETHKLGLLTSEKKDSFGLVNDFNNDDFKSTDVKQGDAIFFSSFLVHSSGNNITNNIRWSTHFRYNDLNDKSFINNGYPHAYTYKPVDDMLLPDFDTKEATKTYFENI